MNPKGTSGEVDGRTATPIVDPSEGVGYGDVPAGDSSASRLNSTRDYFPQPRATKPGPDAETFAAAVERNARLRIRIIDHDGDCSIECGSCVFRSFLRHAYSSAYLLAAAHNRVAHRSRCVIVHTNAAELQTASA